MATEIKCKAYNDVQHEIDGARVSIQLKLQVCHPVRQIYKFFFFLFRHPPPSAARAVEMQINIFTPILAIRRRRQKLVVVFMHSFIHAHSGRLKY